MDFVPDLAVQSPFLFFSGGLNSFFPIKMIKTLYNSNFICLDVHF